METPNIIKTEIKGLEIQPQKVVGDERGMLAEMIQGGTENPVTAHGIRNIYTSIAVGKHTGRAAHYHYKLHELFFTLTGTALWLFHDFRKDSPTFGKSAGVVVGFEKPNFPVFHDVLTLDQKQFARVVVPAGVYHAYWPLTDEKVMVVAVASQPHDNEDYWRGKPAEVPGFPEILGKYGIVV